MIKQPRLCRFKMRGNDVKAYKRALAKGGYRKWQLHMGRRFGKPMHWQVCNFQKRHGLEVDGVIGAATYAKMYHLFDGYSRYLLRHTKVRPPADTEQTKRNKLANIALYERRQAGYIHYSQGGSRMAMIRYRWRIPACDYRRVAWTDCSAFVTWVYWQAGSPDPNGRGYDLQGYTGTLQPHGTRIDHWGSDSFKMGDLVFYGYPIHHVAIYVGRGLVVSHGSEGGPYLLPWRYRSDVADVRRYKV